MDLTMKRTELSADGIFGEILDDQNSLLFYSLEHAYDSGLGNGTFEPKIPPGIYTCSRGRHQLPSMSFPFETFEVTGVPGHINILFHVGNYNNDSSGCILLGSGRSLYSNPPCITKSKIAFDKFLVLQNNVNEFKLTVL